jgi:hypothetical protein
MFIFFSNNITRDDLIAIDSDSDIFLVISPGEIHPRIKTELDSRGIESIGGCSKEAITELKDELSCYDITDRHETISFCKEIIRGVREISLRD